MRLTQLVNIALIPIANESIWDRGLAAVPLFGLQVFENPEFVM